MKIDLTDEQWKNALQAQAHTFYKHVGGPASSLEAALLAAIESLPEPPKYRLAPGKTDWVRCPICGEGDMAREEEADGEGAYILCVNCNCGSNGGTNFDGLDNNPSPHARLRPIGEMPRECEGAITVLATVINGVVADASIGARNPQHTHYLDILLPTPEDAGRAEFEEAAKKVDKFNCLVRGADGMYQNGAVQFAWNVFQAAREKQSSEK